MDHVLYNRVCLRLESNVGISCTSIVHLPDTTPSGIAYGTAGYQVDCNSVSFGEVMYLLHTTQEKAYFRNMGGVNRKTIPTLGYNAAGSSFGHLFRSFGASVASSSITFQLTVCDQDLRTGTLYSSNNIMVQRT